MKFISYIPIILFFITGVILGRTISNRVDREIIQREIIEQDSSKLSEWQLMQLAIIKTESDFNPLAIGKSKDLGIMQLTPIYVKDINRISGKEYIHEDAFSPQLTLKMFDIYQNHYNPDHDILKAIHLHNPRGESIRYETRVLRNIEYIRKYESIRSMVIQH